jgi:hypothetical protein
MPQPTLSDVHANKPLTDLSFAYTGTIGTVADKLFPTVPSQNKSDDYYVYPKGNWFRVQARKRAPGTESVGSGYALQTDSFSCDVIALHKDIDDQIRSNADPVLNMDADATRFLTQQLVLKREVDFAAAYFATGQWTGSSTGNDITPGTKWDAAAGDPIKDIRTQMTAMHKKTGIKPNKLCLGKRAWDVVLDNAAVLDRIKYGASNRDPAMTNEGILAQILGLEQILVAEAIVNSGEEGAADSMGYVFTEDSALLCYAAPTPGILMPSAGYCFTWQQYLSASNGIRFMRMRNDLARSDRVEGEMAYTFKRVASDLGVLFTSVDT